MLPDKLCVFAILALCLTASCSRSGVTVSSVTRANEYREPPDISLRPSNPDSDVILVAVIRGVPAAEAAKLGRDDLYVMAGSRRCVPNIRLTGSANGKPYIQIAVIVPRNVTKFTVIAGPGRQADFAADEKISPLAEVVE